MVKFVYKVWKFIKKYGVFLYFGAFAAYITDNLLYVLVNSLIFSTLITIRDHEIKLVIVHEVTTKTKEWVMSIRRRQRNEKHNPGL